MKPLHLRGRKNCDFLLKKGEVWRGQTMSIRWLPGQPRNKDKPREGVYLGTFAGTKLHKSAVKRNRMRRRCREALRKKLREISNYPTVQLLVSPRARSLDCSSVEVQTDAEQFLDNLPLWLKENPSVSSSSS